MTRNSQLSTTKPKIQKQRQLSKQLEQEQNHRNGDHMEGYKRGERRMGGKVQGIRNIIGRYKLDRWRLIIVEEMEKPNNLHVRSIGMN